MEQVEVQKYFKEGYMPLVRFEHWRVAALNSADKFKEENFSKMEKHLLTDEVFILIKGGARLITGGFGEKPENLEIIEMIPGTIYNVKKDVWHHIFVEEDSELIIVENDNTGVENTAYAVVSK